MNVTDLQQYIQNPDLLSEQTLPELKLLLEQYPCFQVLKMLYLLNLWKLKSSDFKDELEHLAIGITDRKVLYVLLKGNPVYFEITESSTSSAQSSFDLIDAFLASSGDDSHETDTDLVIESTASADYLNWIDNRKQNEISPAENEVVTEEIVSKPVEDEVKLKHQNLIDSFLESDTASHHLSLTEDAASEETFVPEEEEEPNSEESEDFALKQLDDSYFTETLARIYVKQKRYDKALQIIKNLNLKYPEKNIYFADQIRFLEKLIINTKK